jgi:ATP-independent RNA helicase DbpA
MTHSFSGLGLRPALLDNLSSLGYTRMTPVQAECLPHVFKGKDVIVQARTGSGKTAAFGLGLLQRLDVGRFRVQSMVLCPTRELADQVARELRRLARAVHNVKVLLLCGGMPFGPQLGSLEHGAHIVVGTPGRLDEHLRKGSLDPAEISCLVLDEADRMLDMGFQEAIRTIAGFVPKKRQTLLFSATYPDNIRALASDLMRHPLTVTVDTPTDVSSIRQKFYRIEQNKQRLTALRLLLLKQRPESALVFCNMRRECEEVAASLREKGFSAIALHGDLQQRDRDEALTRFANRSVSLLVATDVAARGLDIDDLDAVFNFHVARDPETHVHRVGRTGRAGKKGQAFTLFSDQERHRIDRLADYLEHDISPEALPPFSLLEKTGYAAPMVTLQIDGGRKQKVRPGDILGALTGKNGIAGKQVGKIDIFDHCAYVAVDRSAARPALRILRDGKLKGRSFRARRVHG